MSAPIIPVERLLAVTAKVLCSAVYVSKRDPEEAFRNSAPSALHALQLPDALRRTVHWHLDREERRADIRVKMSGETARIFVQNYRDLFPEFDADWQKETRRLTELGTVIRSARFAGDQGSMILPEAGDQRLHFQTVALNRGPRPSEGWLPQAMIARHGIDSGEARRRMGAVLDMAFADEAAAHAAILVARDGHILGERYAEGFDADMPLESWSIGKSVMSTLIGILVGRGLLELDAPAPVAAWRAAGDPRGRITLRHLLNMSSGLQCTGYQEPRAKWSGDIPDHFHPYTEAIDVATFATGRSAEYAPAEVGRYRNCDTLSLATIYDERVRVGLGGNPLSFPQTELFDRLGMYGLTHETDRWGRFIISGFNYGTARDWARLAHLYLNDGVWDGDRVLPEGWTNFVRAPAPAWKTGNYGAQFWLNTDGEYPLPKDTFYMAGGGGQFVFIVPSLDLVIVRHGHSRGWKNAKPRVNRLLQAILEAMPGEEAAVAP